MKIKMLSIITMICITTFTYLGSGKYINSSAAASDSSSSALTAIPNAPDVTAETAIVADADTGLIYYEKNMHTTMYPASITKILTGLLAVEKGNPNDIITVPDNISQGMPSDAATIALTGGEQITQDEAMYTMFLASANDSANAIALHIGGTIENFVSMMNERASELGAVDSHFDNANGLPDKNNITSAYDMALITKKALSVPALMKYFGATSYTLPTTNKRSTTEAFSTLQKMMKNTVYHYDGTIAGKTGWETMSGHTMVTAAQRGGRTLICVVMKSSDGYTVYDDTIALLNYGFSLTPSQATGDYLKSPVPKASVVTVSTANPARVYSAPKAEPVVHENSYEAPLILIACAVILLALLTIYTRRSRLTRRRARKISSSAEYKKIAE